MNYFTLRVDMPGIDSEEFLSYISGLSAVHMYAYEGGDENPHMHLYLEASVKGPAIRSVLRSKFGLKGNGSYALKSTEKRPIAYLAYLMKEGNWTNSGIPSPVIEQAKKHNEKVVKDLSEKKKGRKSQWDTICEEWEEAKLDAESLHTIVEFVIRYYKGKKCSSSMMTTMSESLYLKYGGDIASHNLACLVIGRINPPSRR